MYVQPTKKMVLVFPFKNTRYLPSRCKKVPFIQTVKVQQIINVGTHLLLFNSVSSTCQPSYSKKKGKREGGAFFFRGIRNGSVKTWVLLFVSFLQAAALLNSMTRLFFQTNNTKYSLNCSELWMLFMAHVRKTPSNSELHNVFLLHSSPIFSHYHVTKNNQWECSL